MTLCPVDADGDLGAGGAELLEEAAVRADPQVALGDFHLQGRSPELAGADGGTQSLPATVNQGRVPIHPLGTARHTPARPGRGHLRHRGTPSPAWCPGPAVAG